MSSFLSVLVLGFQGCLVHTGRTRLTIICKQDRLVTAPYLVCQGEDLMQPENGLLNGFHQEPVDA